MPKNEISGIVSWYFVGFGLGVVFFFFPDHFGRKKSLNIFLIAQVFAVYLTIFSKEVSAIKIGFFLQGVFHMKTTITYVHCIELMDEASKMTASMCINAFDSGSLMVSCIVFYYWNNNVDDFLRLMYFVGCAAIVLYMLVIPESPRWQFMSDCRSKEGIDNMNYIAWFNGSEFRVPNDAIMDKVGQVLEENNTLNNTNVARLKF